jgi:O-antigen/teichoic acid export membrane protein
MTNIILKIKKFFKKFEDLSSIAISNFVGTAISTLFWLFLATMITTEEYGQISYFIAIGSIASVLALVGGGSTITVYTAKKIPIASTVLLISIIASIISAIAVLIIIPNPIISIFVVAYVIFGLTFSYYLGAKQFKKYSKIFIIQKIVFVALAFPLNDMLGPEGVVLGMALSFFIPSYTAFKIFKEMKIDFSLLRTKKEFMQNMYIKEIASVVQSQCDKIVIAPFFGFALLGNYYLGLQFLSALAIIPVVVVQITLTHDSIGTSTYKLKKWIVGLSVIMALLGVFIAPQILSTLFPKFEQAETIIQILSIAIVPRTIWMMYQSKFLGGEKSRVVLIGSIIASIIQIMLIFILGSQIGVNGIASAVVITDLFLMTYYIISKKRMKT